MSLENMQAQFMDYPMEVSVESQTVCNAACTFCPYPILERKGNKMPTELLNKLADEVISWNRPVYFSPFKLSDPLLDNRLIPLMQRINAESEHVVLRIFTNGSALTPSKIAEIAGLKRLAHLWVSLNSHIPEEYEKLMGLKFERVAKNLDYLHTLNFPHQVVLSCVGYPNEDFRRYCFERWPKFASFAIKKDAWLGFTDAQVKEVPDTGCSRWFELSVQSTGEVAHCCMHDGQDKTYNIGDIREQTLLEVYNSPRWKDRRVSLLSRKQLDQSSPCAQCTY